MNQLTEALESAIKIIKNKQLTDNEYFQFRVVEETLQRFKSQKSSNEDNRQLHIIFGYQYED